MWNHENEVDSSSKRMRLSHLVKTEQWGDVAEKVSDPKMQQGYSLTLSLNLIEPTKWRSVTKG